MRAPLTGVIARRLRAQMKWPHGIVPRNIRASARTSAASVHRAGPRKAEDRERLQFLPLMPFGCSSLRGTVSRRTPPGADRTTAGAVAPKGRNGSKKKQRNRFVRQTLVASEAEGDCGVAIERQSLPIHGCCAAELWIQARLLRGIRRRK